MVYEFELQIDTGAEHVKRTAICVADSVSEAQNYVLTWADDNFRGEEFLEGLSCKVQYSKDTKGVVFQDYIDINTGSRY